MRILNSLKIIGVILVSSITLLSFCDFTPPILKEIDRAQQAILSQNYQDAISIYTRVLKKTPSKDLQIKIYYQLGELYSIYLSENAKSIGYYKKVKELSEDPLWLKNTEERLGEVNFTYLKNYGESVKSYEKLSKFTPKLERHDFYKYRLALSYLNDKQLTKSETLFNEIIGNVSHEFHVIAYYHLGMINFQRKKWKKAISYWKDYIRRERRKDNIVQAKFLTANAYETMENLKIAYNLYYSILGEYPNTDVIKNRLNSIYNRRVARKR